MQLICGIDVSSRWLDAALGPEGLHQRFSNTAEGIAGLAAFCHSHAVSLVALEATGGYERRAFALLAAEGFPVAVLNPRSVRQFAQGMGRLEKTDRIDAAMIAWFAAVKGVRPTPVPNPGQVELRALVTRLRQLTEVRTAQLNQQRLLADARVQSSFDELLALLKRQIDSLAQSISERIDADPLWAELNRAFRTIKGVADRTVARLMAELPEIGTISGKAVSKLAGLAPLAQDSGKYQGKRSVRGGRGAVRDILFIVASVCGRHEPDFVIFRQRLAAAGKPPKVVRIALAHKLLLRLNAKARQTRQELHQNTTNPKATTPQAAFA